MDDVRDRRRYPRYEVAGLPGVLDGELPFQAVTLSSGGALLKVAAELSLDQHVEMALELGRDVFNSAAYVVFVGPDLAETGKFRVGLAFADTPDEDRERLRAYIERALAAADLA
jgi:hypothetical protein